VVGRFRVTATHTGDGFMGMKASGNKFDVAGIAIFKFRDGKIMHEWNMDDIFGMLLQIGAIPHPASKLATEK
jgi:predicted ester cyclase